MRPKDDKSLVPVEQKLQGVDGKKPQSTVSCVSSKRGGACGMEREMAYYKRVMECLSSFIAVWRYCDDICNWRINPVAVTILSWLILVVLIICPEPLLFLCFLMLFSISFRNYAGWSAYHKVNAHGDELDEEDFDTYPYSDSGIEIELLRRRYDKLRRFQEHIRLLLIEFPAPLERAYSIWCCKGEGGIGIATFMFSYGCYSAAFLGLLSPRSFLFIIVTYLMRPPIFRGKASPVPASVVVASSTVGNDDYSSNRAPRTLRVHTSTVGRCLQDGEEEQDRASIIDY